MIEKSPDAFRTISEVSRMLGVAAHVLRFWEGKFTQLRPVKKSGGRRYYRPEDIVLLKTIQNLLHHKRYTIEGAQQVLRELSKSGRLGNGVLANGDAHTRGGDIGGESKIDQARACLEEAKTRLADLKTRMAIG